MYLQDCEGVDRMATEMNLRYGANPHQIPARVFASSGNLPMEVLGGSPGYINLLDAVNAWQLVTELSQATGLPAAASFKHVSPAGAAVGTPLDATTAKMLFVDDLELSPVASAYARARGADRMSSFGDWAAVSETVDLPTAKLLKREVSDGIIAPDFEPDALELLRKKKNGKYNIIRMDPSYSPPETESRQIFGITFEQRRNDITCNEKMFENLVTSNKDLSASAVRDLLVAQIALKYTQSNSVVFAYDGQVIGVGAGQQSRVHCTRLAAGKADLWFLRRHPKVLELPFKSEIKRPDRDNAIDLFLAEDLSEQEQRAWEQSFSEVPQRLTSKEKKEWIASFDNVALASDAFFPFRDSIDRAARSGVKFVVEPGGALRDDAVIEACNEYEMAMAFSGVRLFHH